MKYFGLYIKELIKMLIGVGIISGVGLYFFPNKIMLIICGVLVIGAFGAAGDAVKTAKTEESKNRLRETLEENDDYEDEEDEEEIENIISNEEKVGKKASNKKNDSIFDDIELD